jgi:hypothetical protein
MGDVDEKFSFIHWMHFQPTTQSMCVKRGEGVKCLRPDVVGHTETLQNDVAFTLSQVPKLDVVWSDIVSKANSAPIKVIEKGTILNHREELLLLCKVFWNDFQCGHYQNKIPQECQEENEREWHQPDHCIDLNNQRVEWPDHRESMSQ